MIPITKPTLSPYEKYADKFREVIESGQMTNGKYVKELEEKVAAYLGVQYCVAVSSCTSGMMLVLKGLGLTGKAILPSFTFSATGHPLLWNNITPVFADIDPDTYAIDTKSVESLITKKTQTIVATHIFGNTPDIDSLETIAKKYGLKLMFDAAHAFGSEYKGKKIGGFGDAEIFSCSPTKVLTTGEGGFVTTNNEELADFCRIGRNYGDDGSYNTKFNGLNARMSEFHAIVGLESINHIEENLKMRHERVNYFKEKLLAIDPKITFQIIRDGIRSTFKDFSLFIDPQTVGYTRDELHDFLLSKNIIAKKYFYPPLHLQETYKAYKNSYDDKLPVTNKVATHVLSLPMFSHITTKEIDEIIGAIKEFYA